MKYLSILSLMAAFAAFSTAASAEELSITVTPKEEAPQACKDCLAGKAAQTMGKFKLNCDAMDDTCKAKVKTDCDCAPDMINLKIEMNQ